MIAFTLVKPELRYQLMDMAKKNNVIAVDLLGPLLDRLEDYLGIEPKLEPGLVHKLDEDYYKRLKQSNLQLNMTMDETQRAF